MRPPFSDVVWLREKARENSATGLSRLKRWWVSKYKLPASHELFQKQTVSDLMMEFYEDLYDEREVLEQRLSSGRESFSAHSLIRERILDISKALGEKVTVNDPLAEKWLADMDAGQVPDLDMMPQDLKK